MRWNVTTLKVLRNHSLQIDIYLLREYKRFIQASNNDRKVYTV